jgi:hydroxyacylglutathione hydrolase
MRPSCGVNVHVLPAGPIPTNAYLLTEPGLGEAVLVDAPEGIWEQVEPLLAAERCRLAMLWLTHGHWDHTQGAAEVVRRSGAKAHGHAADRLLYERPELMRSLTFPGAVLEPVAIDRWLEDGACVDALGARAAVSHVPGHCPGSLMFHFPGARAAFPGDAIFRGSIGRTDIPGGDLGQLEASIRGRIYALPDETQLFPGHGGPTTVGAEKATNPYVRA